MCIFVLGSIANRLSDGVCGGLGGGLPFGASIERKGELVAGYCGKHQKGDQDREMSSARK